MDGVSVLPIYNREKEIDGEKSEDETCRMEELNKYVSFMAVPPTSHDFFTNPLKVESLSRD